MASVMTKKQTRNVLEHIEQLSKDEIYKSIPYYQPYDGTATAGGKWIGQITSSRVLVHKFALERIILDLPGEPEEEKIMVTYYNSDEGLWVASDVDQLNSLFAKFHFTIESFKDGALLFTANEHIASVQNWEHIVSEPPMLPVVDPRTTKATIDFNKWVEKELDNEKYRHEKLKDNLGKF